MTVTAEQPSVIHAPWPLVIVAALRAYQHSTEHHPYTCPADGTLGSSKHSDSRILSARHDGWHCRFHGCDYRQSWVGTEVIDVALSLTIRRDR